ncbi:MAG: hypothetical protein GF399_13005 [Candidatus Coatesbacteria bacterium]|nr:hypothetical protein [Candidatus Coatesbacteria bacterium]
MKRLLVFSLMIATGAGAALPAATVPLDHWAYEVADELVIRGLWTAERFGERPWSRADFAAGAGYLLEQYERGEVGLHPASRGWLDRLVEEFAPEIERWRSDRGPASRADYAARDEPPEPALEVGARLEASAGYRSAELQLPEDGAEGEDAPAEPESGLRDRERLELLFGGGYGDELALWGRAEADTDGLEDSDWRGLDWKAGISAQFDYGFLRWRPTEWFQAWAGRDQLQWGYSIGGSLLFSGTAPAPDGFGYGLEWGPLRFSYFHCALDTWREGPESDYTYYNRFLVGHRLSWQAAPWLVVGLGEATTYGGEGRGIDLAYLNQLMLHYVEQLAGRVHNDNPFWQLDVDVLPFPGGRFWGQLMIDDYQYEDDPEPPHIGFLAGAAWADPLNLAGLTLSLEYLKVWNWVYNVKPDYDKLLYLGHPLGFPRGNDADRWSFRLNWDFGADWSTRFAVTLDRKGEGRIEDEWEAKGFTSEPFPSGVVEELQTYALSGAWHPNRNLEVGLELALRRATNYANLEGAELTDIYAGLSASYLLDWR